jgi:hypothetical protein
MQNSRGYVVELADIDQGSRLVGDVDNKVIVSRGYSRRNRSSDPRHSAEAQVRRTVAAPVACNQVLPTFLDVAQKRRRHGTVARDGRAVLTGRNVPGGWNER